MAFLYIENTKIFDPDSYEISTSDIMSDASSETEAGTKQIDFIRKNVHIIDIKVTVTERWAMMFAQWRNMDKVLVNYMNEFGELSGNTYMKFSSYKASLNTQSKQCKLFEVSFSLEEI